MDIDRHITDLVNNQQSGNAVELEPLIQAVLGVRLV